jgi:predicted outer membrane repeat protein
VWSFTTVGGEAQCDYPEDGAVIPGDYYGGFLYTELVFIPGPTAVKHTGYFSDNYDDVANRAEVAKIPPPIWPPPPPEHRYIVPPLGESLVRGQVYYWTVDSNDALGNTFAGEIWEFTIQGFYAYAPSPPNEAILVDTNLLLSWWPGFGVTEHDVYFGTNFDDVNNAMYNCYGPTPGLLGTVSEPNILVTSLAFNTTYFWRVDEVPSRMPPPICGGMYYKGDVWCFTILPEEVQPEFPADGEVITGHEITYLGDYYIWTNLIFIPSATAVEHTGYFSEDYSKVESRAEDANLGSPPYAYVPGWEYTFFAGHPQVPPANQTLVRDRTYYWTVDETDAQGITYPGEIWEFAIWDFYASEPDPPNEAVDVDTIILLSWRPGYDSGYFYEHDVYIGTNWEDVNNAVYDWSNQPPEFLATTTEPNILVTDLAFNTAYYWRVDEVRLEIPPLENYEFYKGYVWSFTTIPHRIFVDIDAAGANNGASWENAYKFLQDALIDANSALKPVEIWVAEGIYTPDSNSADPNGSGDRNSTFQLIDGVTLKGGYAGFGQPNPNARDIELYETILSGDLDGNDVEVNDPCDLLTEPTRAENSYHVVTGSGTDETAVLDGFTITCGSAEYRSRLELFNADNAILIPPPIYGPENWGGGLYNLRGSPTVSSCTFTKNTAYSGGAIYNLYNSSPMLNQCTFSENIAGYGGGLYNSQDNSILTNCTFNGNVAIGSGGGILSHGPILTLTDCVLTENSAGGSGGAILNGYGNLNMTNCTLRVNCANYNGGGIYSDDTNATLVYCTLNGNYSGDAGGGMYNYRSDLTLINCIFSGNSGEVNGGGIYCRNNSLTRVINCTFAVNSALYGTSLACDSDGSEYPSSVQVTNCILWNGGNEVWNNDESTIAITYSNVESSWPGDGNIDADPCFVDAVGGDLRLSLDSPCIDTGDNNAPNLPATDFDGHPRIIDGDCNDTEVVDMGAFEFNYAYMGDFDYNCRVNFADLSIFGLAWRSQPGDFNWDFACNIGIPADNVIDRLDLAVFADNWLAGF